MKDNQKPVSGGEGDIRVVYRAKTKQEAQRRVGRAEALVGTPFVPLPGIADHRVVLFTSKDGTPVPAEMVEMVFNDCLLSDVVSNWGEDGPLYRDTLDNDLHREVYEYAIKVYAGVEIPECLRKPG